MLKISLISFLLGFSMLTTAQTKSHYSAMILSLKGEGVLLQDGKEIGLKMLQRFSPGDQLTVQNGEATIMLFSGEEIAVAAISDYTIPEEKTTSLSNVSEMANRAEGEMSLITQSGSASRIRGKSKVFPLKSKAIHQENIILRLNYAQKDSLNLSFVLKDAQTQKVILQLNEVMDSTIDLSEVPFVEGKSYYWTMHNTPHGRPANGTIVCSRKEQFTNPFSMVSKHHCTNLNNIFELYNNRYYFDAYQAIQTCIKAYPNQDIYKVLLKNTLEQ